MAFYIIMFRTGDPKFFHLFIFPNLKSGELTVFPEKNRNPHSKKRNCYNHTCYQKQFNKHANAIFGCTKDKIFSGQ